MTPFGLDQSKLIPIGMKNAHSTFQRLMNKITRDLNFCATYIDDGVIFSDDWKGHRIYIRKFFERLTSAKMVINLVKSEIAHGHISYLGYIVGQGKVFTRSAKIKAILELPAPTNKRELLRFL